MGITASFANWIATVKYEDIPSAGIEAVKQSMLDWIGCALVGSRQPAVGIVVAHTQEQAGAAQARLVASGIRTTTIDAAFTNGVMGHIEDFDDSGAHPASYLTPTVLALAEERALSGKQVLAAWAIGYEISARIAAGLHPDRPWHTTAIYGTMGATAAACRLMGLEAPQVRMALGIAASESGGVMRNFGTMTKAFHPGNAARSGIMAGKLARRGYLADPDIIEARYGYADCFGGDNCDLPAMTRFLGEVFYIAAKPPAIKAWPTCSSNHQSLTGIFDFLRGHVVNAADVLRVEHYGANVPGTGSLQRRNVRSGLEGKFCLEYNIAAAFIDRKVDLSTFTDERAARGDLQDFMSRVFRYQSPEAALHSRRTKAGLDIAHLRVFMKDGAVHDLKLAPRLTLTGAAVVEKFRANARAVLHEEAIAHVISLVQALDGRPDTRELMDTITTC